MKARPTRAMPRGAEVSRARVELVERLRARRDEIEGELLARVRAIADPGEASDPTYAEGLRAAVATAVDYALEAVWRAEGDAVPVPIPLLAQARLAARSGVSLDTVLRRYVAGYSLLGDFLIEEAGRSAKTSGAALQSLLATQAALLDRLVAAISEEYVRESATHPNPSADRLAKLVGRLLDGELVDTGDIAYDFEAWHLGILASGPGAAGAIAAIAGQRECRLLTVRRDSEIWAWLGTRRGPEGLGLGSQIGAQLPAGARLAVGEPAEGLPGWRLTHRQAVATYSIAERERESVTRYANVALLATAMRDDLLVTTLHDLYLAPLRLRSDDGEILCRTLRAYFDAGSNVSSAAAKLGVKRHTVTKRLRAVEEKIGRPIDSHAADIDMALRIDRLHANLAP